MATTTAKVTTSERVELVERLICDTCSEEMRVVVEPLEVSPDTPARERRTAARPSTDAQSRYLHRCANDHEVFVSEIYPRTRVELRAVVGVTGNER